VRFDADPAEPGVTEFDVALDGPRDSVEIGGVRFNFVSREAA
jgi:hypothetical protein